jgi:dethiobiotin synthetase
MQILMRSILITGTDTGIGKTHVTGLIAHSLPASQTPQAGLRSRHEHGSRD